MSRAHPPDGSPLPPPAVGPPAELLRAAVLLFVVGASIGGAFATLAAAPTAALVGFALRNTLDPSARARILLVSVLCGTGLASRALVQIAFPLRTSPSRVAHTIALASLLGPLAVVGLLPPLALAHAWTEAPLALLLLLVATVLAFERLLRNALDAVEPVVWDELAQRTAVLRAGFDRHALAIVVGGACLFAGYFSWFTILHHQRLGTSAFDLGININWSWNILHGTPSRCTVLFGPDGGHFLGNHAIFASVVWLPFFALWPTAETFLIYQAVMAAAGGVALFGFATSLLPRPSAVVIAYAYFLFAPLHGPCFYDFHELLAALPWHFALYWAISVRRYRWLWLIVPVLLAHREDLAVGVVVLGLFLCLGGHRRRLGATLAALAAVYFVVLKFGVMPRYLSWWFVGMYNDLQAPGTRGFGGVVQTMLSNPSFVLSSLLHEAKLTYLLHILAPLALLPLRHWALALLACPGALFTLMTTGYAPTLSIGFQYTAHWIPYVFAATVLALHVMGQQRGGGHRRAAALGAVVMATVLHSHAMGAVLQTETMRGGFAKVAFRITPAERARFETVARLARQIPPGASVSAADALVPHVAARRDVFTARTQVVPADYVLLWDTSLTSEVARSFTSLMAAEKYGLVEHGSGVYLFQRGLDSPGTAAARSALGL